MTDPSERNWCSGKLREYTCVESTCLELRETKEGVPELRLPTRGGGRFERAVVMYMSKLICSIVSKYSTCSELVGMAHNLCVEDT